MPIWLSSCIFVDKLKCNKDSVPYDGPITVRVRIFIKPKPKAQF